MKRRIGRTTNQLCAVDLRFILIGAYIYLLFCFFMAKFFSVFRQPKKKEKGAA